MQARYDNAIISGNMLQGGLQGCVQALKVSQAPLSLEERTRVWQVVQRPYRLSASYEVRDGQSGSRATDAGASGELRFERLWHAVRNFMMRFWRKISGENLLLPHGVIGHSPIDEITEHLPHGTLRTL